MRAGPLGMAAPIFRFRRRPSRGGSAGTGDARRNGKVAEIREPPRGEIWSEPDGVADFVWRHRYAQVIEGRQKPIDHDAPAASSGLRRSSSRLSRLASGN